MTKPVLLITVLLLLALPGRSASAGTNASPAAASAGTDDASSQEAMRSYLQLQEQIHATQLAVEQNRKESKVVAAETVDALATRLQAIEGTLASQRAREIEELQSSNRIMITATGTFAALGFVTLLLLGYFQWRTVHSLAEISAALPAVRALSAGSPVPALGQGEAPVVTVGPAEQSSQRLLGAMERLEKRIYELEQTTTPPEKALPSNGFHGTNGTNGANGTKALSANGNGNGNGNGHSHALAPAASAAPAASVPSASPSAESERIRLLMAKGQSLLHVDNAEGALDCFNEILQLAPKHAEALVKKGTALERLQRLSEAIETYDLAIAADSSMTIAYLHKGGLFNRMERFNEALECYEQALRTQQAN